MTPFRAGPDTLPSGSDGPVVAHATVGPALPGVVTPANLTPRQIEVVVHLVNGRSTAVIAHLMGISQTAVQKHLRCAQQRVGVPSRPMLLLWAIRYAGESRADHYLARFRPLPVVPKGHRWSCPCSVCFVRGRQGRRQ